MVVGHRRNVRAGEPVRSPTDVVTYAGRPPQFPASAQHSLLVTRKQIGVVDRSVVMQLPPAAVHAPEPPAGANLERERRVRARERPAFPPHSQESVRRFVQRVVEEFDGDGRRTGEDAPRSTASSEP